MNGRLIGTALLLLGVFGVPVVGLAQDVKLEWKAFKEKDKKFYQELFTETTQTLKAMNQETKQTQKQWFYFEYITKGEEGGNYKVVQKIAGVKMEMQIGGNTIVYSSKDTAPDKINNPMKEFFKTLEKAEFTLTIDPKKMEVKSVDGVKDFVTKLGAVSPAMTPVLNKILSDDAIKQMANPLLNVLPADSTVPKDKKWERTDTLNLGPIGVYGGKHTYTYEGEDKDNKDKDRIKVETALTYQKPDDKEASPFPFKIKKADVKSSKSEGVVLFDKKVGRIDSSTINTSLVIELEVEIANMTTVVTVDQRQTTKLRTDDDLAKLMK